MGVFMGLLGGGLVGSLEWVVMGELKRGLVTVPILGLLGLFWQMIEELKEVRNDRLIRWTHDAIARTQHRRRILRSQDHQDVPDGALSRVQPSSEPQPTDAALSVADSLDEPGQLTVSEDIDDQVPVR